MKYYLGVDGGGTKIDLILFDENYNLVSEGIGGGVTTSYEDAEGNLVVQYPTEILTGTVYVDQLVSAFTGTVDNDVPDITLAVEEDVLPCKEQRAVGVHGMPELTGRTGILPVHWDNGRPAR